jgi:hypothetical protein
LSAGIGLILAFVSDRLFGSDKEKDVLVLISIVNFSIWSYVFSNFVNSICAFIGIHSPEINALQKSNGWRQMLTQGLNSVLIIAMLAASKRMDPNTHKDPAMIIILSVKLLLELFLVGYFIMLYKFLHQVKT